jgi:hypothetical protein
MVVVIDWLQSITIRSSSSIIFFLYASDAIIASDSSRALIITGCEA